MRQKVGLLINKVELKDEKEEFLIRRSAEYIVEKDTGSFWPIIFALAIGIHSFFEGLGMGLAESRFHILAFFAAIFLHKWAVALGIGLSFIRENKPRVLSIVILFIFASATPSGAITGLILESVNNQLTAILNAVSAGTFIYIGIVEMLGHEFPSEKYKSFKVLAMILGGALMVSLYFLEELAEGGD